MITEKDLNTIRTGILANVSGPHERAIADACINLALDTLNKLDRITTALETIANGTGGAEVNERVSILETAQFATAATIANDEAQFNENVLAALLNLKKRNALPI